MAQYQTPEEVVAQIPLESLRAICARDPNLSAIDSALAASLKLKDKEQEDKENRPKSTNIVTRKNAKGDAPEKEKKLTAREARRRIVAEIERLAVRALTQHVPKQLLVAAVDELNIDHKAAGNCATSRSVAAKRLFEHISVSTGGVGLKPYLEEEASDELIADLLKRLALDAAKLKTGSKATAATDALLHEATVAFFESFPEELLHDICFEMKNERASTETASRQLLVMSIVSNVPVGDLIPDDEDTKKPKPKKLSKKKPKLVDGVSYEDVYQWYYLNELQDYARDHDIKVSGKKRDLILRILAFLSTGETDVGRAKPKPQRKKKKESKATKSDKTDDAKDEAKDDAKDEHDGEEQGQEEQDEEAE